MIDHRGAPVEHTTWRTYMVLAHTLSCSCRIVARSAARRLDTGHVERILDRWVGHVFGLSQTTLVGRGVDRIDPTRPHVLLSNHQSLLDIPAVVGTFPGSVRFVAKEELRRVPAFGRAMDDAGIVFVDRANRARAIQQLEAARKLLEGGTSVWIAAEGTRSRDGRLHGFKKGGFHTAMGLGVPIVPTWISGTLAVIPPDQWGSVTGQTVSVSYGTPIDTRGRDRSDLSDLMAQTRAAMLALAASAGEPASIDGTAGGGME